MRKVWLIIRIVAYAIVLYSALLGDRMSMIIVCLVFSTYFLLAIESHDKRGDL